MHRRNSLPTNLPGSLSYRMLFLEVCQHSCGRIARWIYVSSSRSRPTILFFMISGLDMLGALDTLGVEEKSQICDWIYTQQVTPRPGEC